MPQQTLGELFTSVINKLPDEESLAEEFAGKADPVFTGTMSLGRLSNSTVGQESVALGAGATASGQYSIATGSGTTASNSAAHSEGNGTTASGAQSHAEGGGTQATAASAHAEGSGTQATATNAHAEGGGAIASGVCAHAEGEGTTASGEASHAEGWGGSGYGALGKADHVEGYQTKANSGSGSDKYGAHAEGRYTTANGNSAHAEGYNTSASGNNGHAEGDSTYAYGYASHAEGCGARANGSYSHAQGYYTIADHNDQATLGKYNIKDNFAVYPEWEANKSYVIGDKVKITSSTNVAGYKCTTDNNDSEFTPSNWQRLFIGSFAEIVGNGTGTDDRSNARALTWEGDERLMGDVYVGCNADSTGGNKLATEAFVAANYASLAQLMNLNLPQYVEYTVRIDETNENPSSAVVYLDDAAAMSKGSSSWDAQPIFRDIKPCVFQNGEVNYYLDPTDFAKKVDGTASVLDGTDGDVMIEFKKFAYRIYREGDYLYVSITNNPTKVALDPRYTYDAFSRLIEGDLDYFYEGAFKGYVDGNEKLRSIVGVQPTGNKTIGEFRTAAQANGAHYQQSTYAHLKAIQCLYLIKYGSLNSQTALGQGITSVTDDSESNLAYVTGYNAAADDGVISGTMDGNTSTLAKGMCYGGTNVQHMRLFGLEDFWGNIWTWIDGLTTDDSRNIITSWNSYSNEGITATSNTLSSGLSANGSGYIRKVAGTSAAGFMPILFGNGATSSKYWADSGALWASYVLRFGGYWLDGASAGAFRQNAYDTASTRNRTIGGRLSYC